MGNEIVGDMPICGAKAEREEAFVKWLSGLIDKHQMDTRSFIERHISAFATFGATDMADFWRDALAAYDQAWDMAMAERRGERHLKIVR